MHSHKRVRSKEILDRETGEGIPFATIKVYKDGLLKSGTETDMEGQYLISSLDAASYDLEVKDLVT